MFSLDFVIPHSSAESMSDQGELKSVTLLNILKISESIAIPMNLYRGVRRKFFATKLFVDKTI